MTPIDLIADVLQRNLGMLNNTLADLSDADLLTRPCPGANHANWQLGHLILAETGMVNAFKPGSGAPVPDGWEKKYKKENAAKDDASSFANKQQLMDQFAKTRAASVAFIKSISMSDLDKPSPEQMRNFLPTLGHVVFVMPNHVAMHLGQMQVLRRKLGKPILF
jgi:uncharacterized damage-inducible protein DinB